jgi:hypothetical protein
MRSWLGPLAFGLVFAAATAWAAIGAIPYGLMNVAMERLGQGGVNKMSYGNLATPARQPVVRPSPDLAYSSCPYDLSAGPLAIDVTPVPGRYSSLSIFDAATDVIFVRNDVEAKGKPSGARGGRGRAHRPRPRHRADPFAAQGSRGNRRAGRGPTAIVLRDGHKAEIGGCAPARRPLKAPLHAPVAQLDRAPDYESGGRTFESFRVRHFPKSRYHRRRGA